MHKIFVLFSLVLLTYAVKAQDCDSVQTVVESYLTNDENGRSFISDGQAYIAYLDREKAEFKTTFYGNSVYRVAASAGTVDDFVIFTIYDENDNILFTNKDQRNAPFWDFKIASTINVRIETELDLDKKVSGCAIMYIGFQK
ncbi:hypothetical protein SAMN05216474_1350 [Lishizhenia tianjinensis]|uniref:Lipocalin-like domain-containing protein n=1 Tax=Lishizhenia tianjinensis TaxID=477690 RepID=A0A1I6Z1H4_9FLAO|nr:hypothetical protein [Lishizhenia tianjinensis]SFT56448.1 hypothetical protein SAMN05216474_1350 [Lishizhenia tianjinensis]